jgi:hypothetical protein
VAGSLPVSCQAAGWPAGALPTFWAGRCRTCGGDGEQGVGAHGQHRVPVEGLPGPDLVLVEADLAFSLLEAFLPSGWTAA